MTGKTIINSDTLQVGSLIEAEGINKSDNNASIDYEVSNSMLQITPLDNGGVLADQSTSLTTGDIAKQPLIPSVDIYQQVVDFMTLGGPVVWILTAFSVIALTIFLMKLLQIIYERPEYKKHLPMVVEHWRNGETEEAVKKLNAKRPVDHVITTYIEGVLSDIPKDNLKGETQRIAAMRMNQLTSYLRPLEVIATLSPLLGLLGTVIGMIEAFQSMQAAGAQVDPSVLSGGIWKALLTTAVGLVVAIPVMVMFNWLERKMERVADLMNDAITHMYSVSK